MAAPLIFLPLPFLYPFVVYPFNTFKPKTTNKYIFKILSIKKIQFLSSRFSLLKFRLCPIYCLFIENIGSSVVKQFSDIGKLAGGHIHHAMFGFPSTLCLSIFLLNIVLFEVLLILFFCYISHKVISFTHGRKK